MDGKEWEGQWLKKCSRAERPWRWDVCVEGIDINSRHDGVGGNRHGERPNDVKDMVGVFKIQ